MGDDWTNNNDWGTTTSFGGGGDVSGGENKKGCFKCGEEGHRKSECPKGDQGGQERKKGCFKCGSEDHISRDCSEPDKCRRCGEEGHMVKDCTQEETTRVVEKEDGTKTEIYVPKEVDVDQLFEQGISSGINFDKFDKIPVKSSGENVPPPISSFEAAGLRKILQDNVSKSGYSKPTPVQKHAIPIIMAKRDLMACAQTGSGKTAAFLLPIQHKLLEDNCGSTAGARPQLPEAVVVAPTRELAIQIKDEARKFGQSSILKSCVVYGGTSVGFQINTVLRGVNVLIATPGRLLDLVEKGVVSFDNVKFLVLDEADRMLDMGFLPDVRRIVESGNMPPKGERMTMMFSATFPKEVQELAAEFLTPDYIFLAIGIVGAASSDVQQKFYEVEKFSKKDKLIEILQDVGQERTLIFVETKRNADFIAVYLSNEGLPTTSIHGDRLQREREEALATFKSGKYPFLVATAVAARGLDIKGVAHVVNFDLPKSIDEYVHRIGRTGRVGNIGKATSFFDPGENGDIAGDLVNILKGSQQEVPDFLANYEGGSFSQGAFGGKDARSGMTTTTNDAEEAW